MKFYVGQPVWAIAEKTTGRWIPGTVTEPESARRARYSLQDPGVINLFYVVSIGKVNPLGEDRWTVPRSHLRPRDEGQHEPATDDVMSLVQRPLEVTP